MSTLLCDAPEGIAANSTMPDALAAPDFGGDNSDLTLLPIDLPETVEFQGCNDDKNGDPLLGYPADVLNCRLLRKPTVRKRCLSVGGTLASVGVHQRSKIRAVYRRQGGSFTRLNDKLRALLSEAIFKVENDLEHRQPTHSQVAAMRQVRNRLYDDLGWNEYAISKSKATKPTTL